MLFPTFFDLPFKFSPALLFPPLALTVTDLLPTIFYPIAIYFDVDVG